MYFNDGLFISVFYEMKEAAYVIDVFGQACIVMRSYFCKILVVAVALVYLSK